MDILEEIKAMKEFFVKLKENPATATSEFTNVDDIINTFTTIINENSDEKAHKNIGTKLNKFNYSKYVNCKSSLDEIIKMSKGVNIEGISKTLLTVKIQMLEKVKKQVIHKISTYEKGQQSSKAV